MQTNPIIHPPDWVDTFYAVGESLRHRRQSGGLLAVMQNNEAHIHRKDP